MHGKKNSEHDKNRKVNGDEERKKKEKNGQKKGWKKKEKKIWLNFGPRENRPMTTTKTALRPAL
jgi:hypothetical protein